MLEHIGAIIVGLIGGVAVGIQGPLAGAMGQKVGGVASSFIIHLSGALFSFVLLFARGGEAIGQWRSLPWYMLGAGIFGLILYITVSQTLPKLGATSTVVLIIVGQLVVGLIIDQFGWLGVQPRPIDATRVLAMLLLCSGAYLIAR